MMPDVQWPLWLFTVVAAIVAAGGLVQGSRYAVWAAQRLIIRLIIAVHPGHKVASWEKRIMRGKGWTKASGGALIPGGGTVGGVGK